MLGIPLKVGLVSNQKESGTEISHSLEFDFVVPPLQPSTVWETVEGCR